MEDWKFLSIIVGIAGALIGVYFRESIRSAYQKRFIAIRLEAYLNNFIKDVLKSEHFKDIFLLGHIWQDERVNALKKGGKTSFIEVDKKYEQAIEKMKKEINDGDNEKVEKSIEKSYKLFREMPDEMFKHYIQQQELIRDYLMSNKNFISDEDAAKLSWVAAHRIVEIRSYVLQLVTHNIFLAKMIRNMDSLDKEPIRELIFEIVKKLIELSMHINPLLEHAKDIRNTSLLKLTLRDIIGKT